MCKAESFQNTSTCSNSNFQLNIVSISQFLWSWQVFLLEKLYMNLPSKSPLYKLLPKNQLKLQLLNDIFVLHLPVLHREWQQVKWSLRSTFSSLKYCRFYNFMIITNVTFDTVIIFFIMMFSLIWWKVKRNITLSSWSGVV